MDEATATVTLDNAEMMTLLDVLQEPETEPTYDPTADGQLVNAIEGLLFVAGGPVPLAKLEQVLGVPIYEVERAVELLERACVNRGLRLCRMDGQAQLVTAPELAAHVERLLGIAPQNRLSAAALETLAIVAYRQPISRGGLERVRGVNSDRPLATLLARDLVAEVRAAPRARAIRPSSARRSPSSEQGRTLPASIAFRR